MSPQLDAGTNEVEFKGNMFFARLKISREVSERANIILHGRRNYLRELVD